MLSSNGFFRNNISDGILVQRFGSSFIKRAKFVTQANRVLKEYFYCNSPEFVIVSTCIFSKYVLVSLLHTLENWTGYFRKIPEFFFEPFIFISLRDKIYISKCMGHFVKTN